MKNGIVLPGLRLRIHSIHHHGTSFMPDGFLETNSNSFSETDDSDCLSAMILAVSYVDGPSNWIA